MDRLVYTSLGAATNQEFLRVQLVNDLANAATFGYKRGGSVSPQTVFFEGAGFPIRAQAVVPSSVEAIDLRAGSMIQTGNALDIAMLGATVMGVQASDGTLAFTRRGDLRVNSSGVLETGNHNIVMGDGGPITVPAGFRLTIDRAGRIMATDPAQDIPIPQEIGQLMLRDASTQQLQRRVDGLYTPVGVDSAEGDFPTGPVTPEVQSETIEGSNVNPVEVMVTLMDMYRSFETQMKIIKATEELDRDGASLISAN